MSADKFHGLLVEFVRETAINIFGTGLVEPTSPWVSKEAVTISKMLSLVRRTTNGAEKIKVTACLGEAFWTWRAKLGVVPFAVGMSSTDDRGWVAVANANDRRSVLTAARRLESTAAGQLAKLGWRVTKELARSKRSFFAATLRKLQRAHYSGDTEVSYRILRQLGKRAPRQVKSLKNKDGVATKDEDEIGEVWTQHLANVLGGHKATSVTGCHAKPKRTVEEYSFWPTLLEVQNAQGKVNAKKALGQDGVGADVWRAGGETLARHILRLLQEVIVSEEVPTGMKGSRAVDLYKGKGPVDGVDSYRVLRTTCRRCSSGCSRRKCWTALRKTTLATSTAGLLEDRRTCRLTSCRPSLDGRREELQHHLSRPRESLRHGAEVMLVGMGMPERVAEWTCEFLRERGSALEQWGVDGKSLGNPHPQLDATRVRKRGGRDHTWRPAGLQNRRRYFRSGVRSGVVGLETRLEALGPHAERTNCAGTTLLAVCNRVRRRARRDVRRDFRRRRGVVPGEEDS